MCFLVGGYYAKKNKEEENKFENPQIYSVKQALDLGFVSGIEDYCKDFKKKDFLLDLTEEEQGKLIEEYTQEDENGKLIFCKNKNDAKNTLLDICEDLTLDNLYKLIESEFNEDDIIGAFVTNREVIISLSNETCHYDGYGECKQYNVYENMLGSSVFLISVDKNNTIIDILCIKSY